MCENKVSIWREKIPPIPLPPHLLCLHHLTQLLSIYNLFYVFLFCGIFSLLWKLEKFINGLFPGPNSKLNHINSNWAPNL